ncbi:MAG: M23 family metallopeptidase, partial [Alloprevotella sp.]|nr:M23 family metallopeptidase [Alloprevotella sp.]
MEFRQPKLRTLGALLIGLCATTATAQDLIANQAPIDRKQKAVDSLTITRLIEKEALEAPSTDLYTSWNNKQVFCYSEKEVPETYKIDLRGFAMPTPSRIVTSRVGYRPRFKRMHKGLDIKVYTGDTIYAAFDGKIRMRAFQPKGYRNVVVIRHNNGLETLYAHLSKPLVHEGQVLKAGQPIGL